MTVKKLLLLVLFAFLGSTGLKAASVTFVKVYPATLGTSKVSITSPIAANSFTYTSANPSLIDFSTANNLCGTLSYTSNGITYVFNGIINLNVKSGSTKQAFVFEETTVLGSSTLMPNGKVWFLIIPGFENQFTNNQIDIGTNSSGIKSDLETLRSTQSSNSAPVITSNGGGTTASISVNENLSTSTSVTTVLATDADASRPSPTETKTFSIIGGVDGSKFTINSSTGALTFSTSPDFENPIDAGKDNSYEVQVMVSDFYGANDVQTINITVLNLNDNAPVIASDGGGSTATLQVTTGNKPITNVDANDADLNSILTYSINTAQKWTTSTSLNPNYDPVECASTPGPTFCDQYITTSSFTSINLSTFSIDANTGQLSFTNNSVTGQYKINVVVSDGTNTDTQTLTINVTTTDTKAPSVVITSSDTKLYVGEVCTVYFKFSELVNGFTSSDLTLAGGTLGTIYQDVLDPTMYYATFTQSGAADPSISVAANSYTDIAGNNGTAGSYTTPAFTKDLIAPTISSVTGTSTDIATGTTTVITITFSEDPGNSFNLSDITVTGGDLSNLLQNGSDPKIWTVTLKATSSVTAPSISIASGSYTDLAGNPGTNSGSISYTLAPPSIDLENTGASDTGSSSTDNITSNQNPTITGLAPSTTTSITVLVTAGASTFTYSTSNSGITMSGSGTKTFVLNLSSAAVSTGSSIPAGGLPEGTIVLNLTATTTGGDVFATNSFIIDITSPIVPTVTAQNSGTTPSSDATPTISGTATVADGEVLTVVVNGVTFTQGDGNLSIDKASNTWTLNIPPANALPLGTYDVTAKVTDLAGKFSTDATSGELQIVSKKTVANGTWESGSTWTGGTVPITGTVVEIAHNITAVSGQTKNTSTIIINSTGKLTNNGTLNIDGNLVQEIDENSVSGQFLNAGSTSITGKIIARKTFTRNKWYYMSFPFDVPSSQIFQSKTSTVATWGDLTGDAQFYVAQYDGQERANEGTISTTSTHWMNVSPRTLSARHGYFIALESNATNAPFTTIDFTSGVANNNLVNNVYSLSETYKFVSNSSKGSAHENWNLAGLPSLSGFNLLNCTNFKAYYIFDQVAQNFTTIVDGDSYTVYPYSAFYLQAYGTNTTVDFASAGRALKAPALINSTMDEINLMISNDTYSDLTRIRLRDDGTEEFQYGIDGYKLLSPVSAVPQIYSITNNTAYSVNSLPITTRNVALTTRLGSTGNYAIQLTDLDKLNGKYNVILKDTETGTSFDLTQGDSYNFNTSTTGYNSRFNLQLIPSSETAVCLTSDNNIVIRNLDKNINITGLSELSKIQVIDITGKLIYDLNNQMNQCDLNIPTTGTYIVKISTVKTQNITKVIVK